MRNPLAWTLALLLWSCQAPAHAQQFLGRLGGSCVPLPANNQHLVPLDFSAPAGATLIVTVATSSNFVSGLEINDVIGSRYQALGGVGNGATGAVVHFRAALQRSIAAGQPVLLRYENAASGTLSCISVLGYTGIAFGGVVQETLGAATGQSSTAAISANAAGTSTRKLVLAAFATNAAPGTVVPQAPASAQPTLCASGNSLCLIDAQYFANPAGAPGVSVTLGNAVGWIAALTSLQADGIFGNGFD